MEKNTIPVILNETERFSLEEFCQMTRAEQTYIVEMVEFGILEPQGQATSEWQFTLYQLQRFRKAKRLLEDLHLNLSGVALSLELLDEIKDLRSYIEALEHQIQNRWS